jgi:hypothetical protein
MFHLEDEDEALELLREWQDQRWRPLFGSLKIDPALPTSELVCTPWPKATEWGEKLAPRESSAVRRALLQLVLALSLTDSRRPPFSQH